MEKNNESGEIILSENNGDALYNEISEMIEKSRRVIYAQANSTTVLLFWKIGLLINNDILENKRADYGKKIVSALATQLRKKYGSSFEVRNLRRMMQFAEQFLDFEIVSALPTQLSWSHYTEILPLKSQEAKLFYLNEAARGFISTRKLRDMINRRAYERKEIADTQITPASPIPFGTFRDPYLFDVLGLKLDRDGILVAEYWTALPPKAEFEQKVQAILSETRERLARRNLLLTGESESCEN